MKMKKTFIALYLLACAAGVGWWLWARGAPPPLPPSTVTTVVKIRFGDGPRQIRKLNLFIRAWTPHSPMQGLMLADIGQNGDIAVLNDRRLLNFSPAGKPVQQFACPWAAQFGYPQKSEIYLSGGACGLARSRRYGWLVCLSIVFTRSAWMALRWRCGR